MAENNKLTRFMRDHFTIAWGGFTGLAMIILFLALKRTGSRYPLGLQLINCLLLVPAIILSLRRPRSQTASHYLSAMFSGVLLAIFAGVVYGLFLVIYLNFVDPVYMYLLKKGPLGEFMSPLILAAVFITEQVCAALIITLVCMQMFREKA